MNFIIVHELPATWRHPARIRLRCLTVLTRKKARSLAQDLETRPGLENARVNHRTGSVLFNINEPGQREDILQFLEEWVGKTIHSVHTAQDLEKLLTGESPAGAAIGLIRFFVVRPFLPMLMRAIVSTASAIPFLIKGAIALLRGKFNVDVLDAAALGTSIIMRDWRTVGMLTMLLALGDALETWTRQRSLKSLSDSLALNVDNVWLLEPGGSEVSVPLASVREGDRLVVRAGSSIPADGVVVSGTALVNQAAMTGEPMPVAREKGGAVYAGTVVEAGEIVIRVTQIGEGTKLNQVVSFIEQSEAHKSRLEAKYLRLADKAVPFTFALAGLVWAATGSLMRASAVLLVDYSCALKLATPLAVMTATRQASKSGIAIRGGRYLEAISEADTLVFDKTGTLTSSHPSVVEIAPAPGRDKRQILKIMACLEEHFPHPVARAVVNYALKEGVGHEEEHTEVEYVVAHGIASELHGHKVRFGSRHYIENDEGVDLSIFAKDMERQSGEGHSLLFLAEDGKAAGMLAIEDPVRPEAASVIRQMRALGFSRILMLTGDDARTAKAVARKVGITEFRAHVLPVDKAKIIKELNDEGCRVMMVGDGINDGPALSTASVGVAMGEGADLAQAVANVLLTRHGLGGLVIARLLSRSALGRIQFDVAAALGLNSLYLLGGMLALVTPAMSAGLHNLTTLGISLNAIRPFADYPPSIPAAQAPEWVFRESEPVMEERNGGSA